MNNSTITTRQKNLAVYIIGEANSFNNLADSDTLADAIGFLEKALKEVPTQENILDAIDWIISCVTYSSGKASRQLEKIREYRDEIADPDKESLLSRIDRKDDQASKEWVEKAQSGKVMRIM